MVDTEPRGRRGIGGRGQEGIGQEVGRLVVGRKQEDEPGEERRREGAGGTDLVDCGADLLSRPGDFPGVVEREQGSLAQWGSRRIRWGGRR
jgi:hypothetical protein